MLNTIQTLELALEALIDLDALHHQDEPESVFAQKAITAIKAALAAPVQAPEWWPAVENIFNEYGLQALDFVADFKAAQRVWVSLTDAEAQWLYDNCRTPSNLIEMVEAKLKEKNT